MSSIPTSAPVSIPGQGQGQGPGPLGPAPVALRRLQTRQLRLLAPADRPALAKAVACYLHDNRAHLAPWDPPQAPGAGRPAQARAMLAAGATAFAAGLALRWWLTDTDLPGQVIGSVQLSAITRGAFHSANLGYAIAASHQGRGLMAEAVQAVIDEAFSPRVNLHRIQASVRPENQRSMGLLQRLGFAKIGLARRYLFIDGDWRDHLLFELTQQHFIRPAHW